MGFDNWDEVRIAYHVARVGTVSGAADALGVHHATVIRHIDALEARLGVKLFQRHARGYTPTSAGLSLLKAGQVAEDQFSQLSARITGAEAEMSGDLIITSLPTLSSMVLPALIALQASHPALSVHYLTDLRVFRLEYGEAHVAVRAGEKPQEPDYVVQLFRREQFALYATKSYIAAHGAPTTDAELAQHVFVGSNAGAPFSMWLQKTLPGAKYSFRSNDAQAAENAVVAGMGIGFLVEGAELKAPDMVQVMPPRDEWAVLFWLVTHVDLHRTSKVQAALAELKKLSNV
jgi:DNA-binding transcriptional LysR family regulator